MLRIQTKRWWFLQFLGAIGSTYLLVCMSLIAWDAREVTLYFGVGLLLLSILDWFGNWEFFFGEINVSIPTASQGGAAAARTV